MRKNAPEIPRDLSRRTLKKVLAVIGKYKILLAVSLLLAAATVVLQLYVPILFGDGIDRIIGEGKVDFAGLSPILARILIVVAVSAAGTWIMNVINNRLAFRTVRDIRAKAIRHIQELPLSYLDSHPGGDLVQRVIADTDQLSDGLLLGFTQLFSGVVTIGVTLGFMFSRDVLITVIVLVMTPVSFLVAKLIASRSFALFSGQTACRGRQTAMVTEIVGNQKIVKAFGREGAVSAEFAETNAELEKVSHSAVFFSSLTNPSTRAVNNVICALVALVGAFRILGGDAAGGLTVGGLSVMLSYANQYMKPFNDISSVITELQNALACAARVFELAEAEPETPEKDAELADGDGTVEIRDAAFSYDKDRTLIEHFSFTAAPGTKTAIVGPTGCGKTTLINLLMRFYDVDSGSVRVDGQDIRDVRRASLRRRWGMVLQDTWLRNGTVRENIAFGRPDATDEDIIRAAKDAHSWSFIRRMPQRLDTVITDDSLSQGQKQLLCITRRLPAGYDTVITEDGEGISQGQKQLLCITRVMLCLPPMLILDEATSSIDTRTEIRIQKAFDLLMQGRTSFIVAHRLGTIRSADRILVMKDGKIIEQGDHESLMKQGGFYTQLYNAQFAREQ